MIRLSTSGGRGRVLGTLLSALCLVTCSCSSNPADDFEERGIVWSGNGHRYEVVIAPGTSWEEANEIASARVGGWYLATVTSADEHAFLQGLVGSGEPSFDASDCGVSSLVGRVCGGLWLGGHATSSAAQDWSWVTEEPFQFTAWGPFEPFRNGDRVRMDDFSDRGLVGWNDVPSGNLGSQGYVLESG